MKIKNYILKAFYIIIISPVLLACSRSSTPEPVSPPVVSSVSPTHGGVGTVVTISGSGFSSTLNENVVLFNGKAATITQASNTTLIVVVPSLAGNGNIKVTSRGRTVNGPQFIYDYKYMVSTFAGNYTPSPVDGTGTSAGFGFLWGLAADSVGNLFVADGSFNLVRKVTSDAVVTTYAGAGSPSASIGQGTHFYYPVGVGVDKNGVVFVTDWGNNRIRKITAPETVVTVAGGVGSGNADGTGTNAYFFRPSGVVADNNTGNLFIVDQNNNSIRKITSAGVVTTLAGGVGSPGSADGTGLAATFSHPNGIAIDRDGNLYIADWGNNKIRKITQAGVVTTLAGSTGGFADGQGGLAKFGSPKGVAVDADGNVYVADESSQRIRKVTPTGLVTTIAGTGATGKTDGDGTIAKFYGPNGIAIGKDGNIYVSDGSNAVIRKIQLQ